MSITALADSILRDGRELQAIDDPLAAEAWASATLGLLYKVEGQSAIEARLGPELVRRAERRRDGVSLAVLEALAAVAEGDLRDAVRGAADRLIAQGVEAPSWAGAIGTARFVGAWVLHDVFDDQESYFATFRYPGREPHIVNAMYDKALGGIIKDASAWYPIEDPRERAAREDGLSTADVEPGAMAARVIDAIEAGDTYVDNDWTLEFRRSRALLLARMRTLPLAPLPEPPEPPSDDERQRIAAEFLAAGAVAGLSDADLIVSHCLDFTCDYLGEGPYRWSPIVVEQFLLDFLPRKVSMGLGTVGQVPAVLRAWVRFALMKRGLEERWIAETEEAVDRFAAEFRSAMTDSDQFGLAKLLGNAMRADGVDLLDQASVERWVEDFNSRPIEHRDAVLRWLDRTGRE